MLSTKEDEIPIRVIHCMHDPDHVYIGRENRFKNLPHSPLHNPFHKDVEEDRDKVCDEFDAYFWEKVQQEDPEIMGELYRILDIIYSQGYVNLGCWCKLKPPKPDRRCHGDTIKKFFDTILNP